ncbi:MAG: DUF1552 domain-containing protein, partial [Planctomycetales bacterium]|nr:DUF1552 domain-containing protein [Planctomycetales bacterium]
MASNRRQMLQSSALGAGALALAPSLGSLSAAPVGDAFPRRFIFIRKSNGVRPNEVALPTFSDQERAQESKKEAFEADLAQHELPAWLRGLDAHKRHMTILQGLSCKMSENGHWSYSSVMGAFKSGRNSLSGIKRATIDFELARLFPSPFGHVELSLTGNYSTFRTGIVAGYSAPGPHQRNYCYADPQTAYNELFKSVVDPSGVDSENQMLAFLQQDEAFKAQSLAGYEKLKLSGHIESLDAIRARNKEVEKMSAKVKQHLPTISEVHAGGG